MSDKIKLITLVEYTKLEVEKYLDQEKFNAWKEEWEFFLDSIKSQYKVYDQYDLLQLS